MIHHTRLSLAWLLILVLMMATVSVALSKQPTPTVRDTPHRLEDTTISLPLILNRFDGSLGIPPFGFQTYGDTGPGSQYYTQTIESGASWLRVLVAWSNVEPTNVSPEMYRWSSFDASAKAAGVQGLKMIGCYFYAPDWAAEYYNGPINEQNYDDFAEFIGALVERYDGDGQDDAPGSPVIDYWELYNEPDAGNGDQRLGSSYWGHFGAEYAHMLSVAYPVIKAANGNAQVMFGGVAHDWFEEDGGPFVREFIDDVLAAGGGQYFDIMSFHAYPAFWATWAAQGPGLLEKTEYIRNKLHEYDLDKPIILTEAGWHSNDAPVHPGSPEIQARYVVELYTQSMAAQVEVMIWWTLYDLGGYHWDNGLVTQEGIPKPSYYAFQTIVSELGTAHFQRALTSAETGASDMEAYVFTDHVHGRSIYVAWLDPMDTINVQPLRLAASIVTVRDIYGDSYEINDSDDGTSDGWVTIPVGGQPVYVEKAL